MDPVKKYTGENFSCLVKKYFLNHRKKKGFLLQILPDILATKYIFSSLQAPKKELQRPFLISISRRVDLGVGISMSCPKALERSREFFFQAWEKNFSASETQTMHEGQKFFFFLSRWDLGQLRMEKGSWKKNGGKKKFSGRKIRQHVQSSKGSGIVVFFADLMLIFYLKLRIFRLEGREKNTI